MKLSFAQKIRNSGKPFTFFHTWSVTKELLSKAITEEKSMDLDVCVDDEGKPYLGHSKEYHEKSGEPFFKTMPLWEAVEIIVKSDIVAMVDCKHYNSWSVIEEVVRKIGPERCLVCSYVSEFKFNYSRKLDKPDYLTEWSKMENLTNLKKKFPSVTITPCAKWLPDDLLLSDKYSDLIKGIRQTLVNSQADTVCLGVPGSTITDKWLEYFLEKDIVPHVMIDNVDVSKITVLYIGETDFLERASKIIK